MSQAFSPLLSIWHDTWAFSPGWDEPRRWRSIAAKTYVIPLSIDYQADSVSFMQHRGDIAFLSPLKFAADPPKDVV